MVSLLLFGLVFVCITLGTCEETEQKWERIVTNSETIYGNQGVPVKFCYNETSVSKGVTSVPGCPKSIDGIPWIYYGNPPRCFLAYNHGPCPFGEKLLAVHGTPFGICACECFVDDLQGGLTNWKPSHLDSNIDNKIPEHQRYFECLRRSNDGGEHGQIFDTKSKKCYSVNTQGLCERGKVLKRLDYKTKFPVCEKPTKNISEFGGDPFPLHGCGPARRFREVTNSVASIQTNRCRAGERYNQNLRKCVNEKGFVVP